MYWNIFVITLLKFQCTIKHNFFTRDYYYSYWTERPNFTAVNRENVLLGKETTLLFTKNADIRDTTKAICSNCTTAPKCCCCFHIQCKHRYCILYKIFCNFLKSCCCSFLENVRKRGTQGRLDPLHFRGCTVSDPGRLHPLLPGPQGTLERPAAETEGLWSQYSHYVRSWQGFKDSLFFLSKSSWRVLFVLSVRYVPWNLHEPERGVYLFQEQLDME